MKFINFEDFVKEHMENKVIGVIMKIQLTDIEMKVIATAFNKMTEQNVCDKPVKNVMRDILFKIQAARKTKYHQDAKGIH